jgi:hypothetical protein
MAISTRISMPVRFLIAGGLLFVVGCGEADSVNIEPTAPGAEQTATSDPKPDTGSTPDAAVPVSLDVLNAAETDKLIARHEGKIVVVDLWALW